MAGERPTVVVDAENVRRSVWPNVSRERLVELVERWAAARDVDGLVVFEAKGETADDRIVREVAHLGRYWLVTSDRELRRRAGDRAEKVIGGGAFIRELTASGRAPNSASSQAYSAGDRLAPPRTSRRRAPAQMKRGTR